MSGTWIVLAVAWAAGTLGFFAGRLYELRDRRRAVEANRVFYDDSPNVVALNARVFHQQSRARARLDRPGFGP